MSRTFTVFKDEPLEAAARDAIRLDEPRALLDLFATLVRESGTPHEDQAGHYIVDRLKAGISQETPVLLSTLQPAHGEEGTVNRER